MFEGINWLGVAVGAVASFVAGWWYYSARGFYKPWSESAGITMERGDPMGASFGSLVVGLILYSTWVGAMVARGADRTVRAGHRGVHRDGLFQQRVQEAWRGQPQH